MKEFRNILIVRTDRMGDVVLTTPALKALREAHPKARISILVSAYTKAIVEGNPYVNEVLADDRKRTHRGWIGFWRLVSEVRKRKFDAAVIYHTKRRTNWLCFFAGIPYRLGYTDTIQDYEPIHFVRVVWPEGQTIYPLPFCEW